MMNKLLYRRTKLALPITVGALLATLLAGCQTGAGQNGPSSRPAIASSSLGYVDPWGDRRPFPRPTSTSTPGAVPTPGTTSASAATLTRTATLNVPAPAAGSRGPSGVVGTHAVDIYAFAGHSNPTAVVAALPKVVDGVSWLFHWSDIETSAGVYNWSTVDAAIAASAGSGRKTMLRILSGAYSPAWVPNQLTFSFQPMGSMPYQTVTMPRTWDPTYISDWTTFIRAYGARYDGDGRVTTIQMTGGGWLGEMTLPQWPGWAAAGYSDGLMAGAWVQFIDAYRAAFPRHPTALDIGEPLQIYFHSHILPTVLAHAQRYGTAINYQENGLKSSMGPTDSNFRTLLALSKTTHVGWQMWGGGAAAGNLMTAFSTAIQSGASYVEVYQNDCVNPSNASALAYLARGGR